MVKTRITPKVCVLRSAGTNCDRETAAAFSLAGAAAELWHINHLVNGLKKLDDFQILALPGGFSYGDDISSGRILANELRFKLIDSLRKFIADGKLIIGICNGFQVLVKSGLLPSVKELKQETSLINNDSGKFESRWVYLKPAGRCAWTKGLEKIIYLPVAHGEGKFVTQDKGVLNRFKKNKQIIFQYCDAEGRLSGYPDNPNGSAENIAGLCDETGRILGLMPHPERHFYRAQHPRNWSLKSKIFGDGLWLCQEDGKPLPPGLQIFKNGVEYVKENL